MEENGADATSNLDHKTRDTQSTACAAAVRAQYAKERGPSHSTNASVIAPAPRDSTISSTHTHATVAIGIGGAC